MPDRRQKRLIFSTITGRMNLSDEVDLEDCILLMSVGVGVGVSEDVGVSLGVSMAIDVCVGGVVGVYIMTCMQLILNRS